MTRHQPRRNGGHASRTAGSPTSSTSPTATSSTSTSSGSSPTASPRAAPRPALLPAQLRDPRSDGRVPSEVQARPVLRSAALHSGTSPTSPARRTRSLPGSRSSPTRGITGGCGNGNYCPNNPVTRQQMAVFLLKALHGSTFVPPALQRRLRRRAVSVAVRRLDRAARGRSDYRRLRRRQLLPAESGPARPDGGVPVQYLRFSMRVPRETFELPPCFARRPLLPGACLRWSGRLCSGRPRADDRRGDRGGVPARAAAPRPDPGGDLSRRGPPSGDPGVSPLRRIRGRAPRRARRRPPVAHALARRASLRRRSRDGRGVRAARATGARCSSGSGARPRPRESLGSISTAAQRRRGSTNAPATRS